MADLITILIACAIGALILAAFMYMKYPTIGDDLSYIKTMAEVGSWLGYQLVMKRTMADIFESWVR